MPDDRVADLLSAWQRRRAAGDVVTPECLCQSTPELLPELCQRIDAIRSVERLAESTPADGATAVRGTPSDSRDHSFDGFTIIRQLGEGGMGRVLEAQDSKLGRRVAIKEMRPELSLDSAARGRFLREARAAAAVRHDHIVPIYHVGEQDGAPFLVMPLLQGESLADRLDRGAMPPADVARVGREAASGLAAAHAAGLIHRDIKPANIWLEVPNGRALILDFGLARLTDGADALTRPGSVLGTPAYLAPEQANGLPLDARADLFSLGVTLYHAATGTRPFQGPTLTSILRAVAEHNPPPPHEVNPAVPVPLSDLIMRLLAKSPADRPASAAAVAEELAGGGPTVTLPNTLTPATESRRRSRRWWIAGGIAAVILGVSIWAVTRDGKQPEQTNPVANNTQPQPAGTPAQPPQYRGSVDLLVYRTNDAGSDVLLPLHDPRAMPLKPGDQVKLVAEVDPSAFLYVFWIDETGAAVPAYPWRFGEWGSWPATEQAVPKVDIKWPGGQALKIEGDNAGTETVLMLARPTKLEASDAEVKAWFAGLKPVPFKGDKARVWFEDFDILRTDRDRAPGMADLAEDSSPLGLQATLRRRIGMSQGFSRAISFSRLGKKGGK